jgi:hypothetical protein
MTLRLTQAGRDAIAFAAAVVSPSQRNAFEDMVRSELSRLPAEARGEGTTHRTIAKCQKEFLRVTEIAVGPAKPRGRGAYKAKAK